MPFDPLVSNCETRPFLIPTLQVRPHEHHCLDASDVLRRKIIGAGVWTHPVLVDRRSRVILDGHHRSAAARALGFTFLPAYLVDYETSNLVVESWREDFVMSKEIVLEAGLSGKLLPIKTSRHLFPVISESAIDIRVLQ